jgi:hypothetical protein
VHALVQHGHLGAHALAERGELLRRRRVDGGLRAMAPRREGAR